MLRRNARRLQFCPKELRSSNDIRTSRGTFYTRKSKKKPYTKAHIYLQSHTYTNAEQNPLRNKTKKKKKKKKTKKKKKKEKKKKKKKKNR